MNEFDRIINAEKNTSYQMEDQDQFVFDTLTNIQASKSRTLKRLLIIALTVLAAIAVLVQVLFFQSASFSNIASTIQQTLMQKPYYLAIFNMGLVAVILLIRRARLF